VARVARVVGLRLLIPRWRKRAPARPLDRIKFIQSPGRSPRKLVSVENLFVGRNGLTPSQKGSRMELKWE